MISGILLYSDILLLDVYPPAQGSEKDEEERLRTPHAFRQSSGGVSGIQDERRTMISLNPKIRLCTRLRALRRNGDSMEGFGATVWNNGTEVNYFEDMRGIRFGDVWCKRRMEEIRFRFYVIQMFEHLYTCIKGI